MFHTLLTKINQTYLLNLLSILFFATFLVYMNTLLNGLFYDDEQFIYENQAVQNFQITDFFTKSLTTGSGQLSNYYRPLLFLSFSLDYQLFGDLGFIYHLSSTVLHAGGGIVLFLFLTKLFQNRVLALITALLWLIHPIQTEAIAYASGRGDPLSFLFVLLTLYLSLFRTRKTIFFALLTFLCALLAKEIALVTPLLLFLTHLLSQGEFTKTNLIKTIKRTLPFFILAGGYFSLRLTVLNFANTLNFYGSENLYTQSLFIRLNTFFHLFPEYLKLLVYPTTLFIEREVTMDIQLQPTFFSLVSFLGVVGVSVLSLWVWIKKKSPYLLFGVGWAGLSFLPTMGILPINGIFYEHFLYYPSVGFFFLFSYGLISLFKKIPPPAQTGLGILVLVMFCLLGYRTVARNAEWRDPITFYNQTLSHAKSARIYNNLAMSYAEAGEQEKALQTYQQAISLSDMYPETHYNMANTYLALGKITEAEKEYKKALNLNPYFYLSYVSLNRLYLQTGNTEGNKWVKEQVEKLVTQNKTFLPLLQQLSFPQP